ncbi:type 2 lanthipeptide synthetase LanM family protein, partial [Microcoleus sp. herbarium12]|uniref:type 2 lanthipeptide synthetase LanM family protein n=1 Tax=Microcoleus sp. herbarium12 TaxID=3055437 RepID=UPI002FCE9271
QEINLQEINLQEINLQEINLQEIIQTASEGRVETRDWGLLPLPIDPENPLPFEDLLLPAIRVARQKLLAHLGSESSSPNYFPLEILTEEAYLKLEYSLLVMLVNLCEKTLALEFSRFRPLGYGVLNFLVTKIEVPPEKTYYQAFVQKLLQEGMLTFFQTYPVLGRLIATRIDFWVEATAEFLQRLKADLPEIGQVFPLDRRSSGVEKQKSSEELPITELGKVVEIKPHLSDPHHRGRSAIALTFESGLKLVYKPKDLGLDVAYNQILEWCNQQSVPLSFKILKVLNRQTYGWVEFVEHLPIEDEAAARRFYQRTGMLLCLLYALGGTDCHHENLIANGEHLLLIDMETLMHHEAKLQDFPQQQQQMADDRLLWDSVLRTGLLPHWNFNKDNRFAYDISGLGSIDPQPLPGRVQQWEFVNTDNMHQAYKTVAIPVQKNVPILNEVPLSPNDYLEELVEGFEQMYHFLLEHREALLAGEFSSLKNSSSPLAALEAQQVRFVFRNTKVYAVILNNALSPQFLKNGLDRSIELDILARAFLTTESKPLTWSILHSELKAMEQLDIPYFAADSDSNALTIGVDRPIQHFLTEPSHTQVISRLQKFDETDLARQVAMIRGTFYARVARSPGTEQAGMVSTPEAADCSTQSPLTREQLLACADAIAEEIHTHAIKEASGSVYWLSLGYVPNADRFQFQPLGANLYDGNCGIALFLAALARIGGSSQFRDLALSALESLRKVLQTTNAQLTQKFAKTMGIGGATGLGSIVYSMVKISQFLQEPALMEDAREVANLITPELIAADQQLDVMAGAAGAILGLLTLYRETTEQVVLDKAIACGQHLLEHRLSVEGSPRAWKTIEDKPLTGFSQGASGIAYALLRLYAVTENSAYLEAALEGIAYERSVFSSSAANWPDFRSSFAQQNGQPGFMVSWCHGAPGIGLARLGGLSILETEEIYQDVEVALQTTQKYGLQGLDSLCCGNFGRTELLLVAAQKLARPELREMALQRATCVVARAEQTGAYQLFPNLPNYVFSPSFFQGKAGIGYELLRLAYPEVLPSVLLLD